jgi:hypothetical protein
MTDEIAAIARNRRKRVRSEKRGFYLEANLGPQRGGAETRRKTGAAADERRKTQIDELGDRLSRMQKS